MDDNGKATPDAGTSARPRLLDQVRAAIETLHYSRRTQETYVQWIKRFIIFSGRRHPLEVGAPEVTSFLSHLAVDGRVAAAERRSPGFGRALLFLYKEVLDEPLPWLDDVVRAKRPVRKPTVLTADEARRLLSHMRGPKLLMASLLYGAGLRLRECLNLRVKDVDFGYRQIMVRDGKGAKDRITVLPAPLIEPLQTHLVRVKALHERDLAQGYGDVELPDALMRKYPRAQYEWAWKFVFPVLQAVGRSAHRRNPAPPCL